MQLQDTASFNERIQRLQHEAAKLPQVHCPVRHLFSPGIYMREMTIPAGTVIVGAAHKHEHFCIVSKGRILVSSEDGDRELTAGTTFLSKPGAQRSGYALEDTVWTTIHHNPSDSQDLNEIVPNLVHARESELLGGADNVQLLTSSVDSPCLLDSSLLPSSP